MKDFHPVGVAINRDGQRTCFLLRHMDGDVAGGIPSKFPTRIVSPSAFEEAVRDGRVELFEDYGNGPVHVMSEEEAKRYKKAVKRYKGELSNEEYWKSEATFADNVLTVPGAINISLVSMRVMSLVNQSVFQCAIYSKDMPNELLQFIKKNSVMAVASAPDMLICNMLQVHLSKLIVTYQGTPITLCAYAARNLDNAMYRVKMMGFRNPTEFELVHALDQLNWELPEVPESQPIIYDHITVRPAPQPNASKIPAEHQKSYQVYLEHRNALMSIAINKAVGAPKVVAVVHCQPKPYIDVKNVIRDLASKLFDLGWATATQDQFNLQEGAGILLLDGWPINAIETLTKVSKECTVGTVTCICAFGLEDGEFIDALTFDQYGLYHAASEPGFKPDHVSKMCLK